MSVKFKANTSKQKSSATSTNRSSNRGSADLQGDKIIVPLNYGGLGHKYFEQLTVGTDKILQVDIIHGITETRGSVRARAIQLSLEMQERGIKKNDIILISSKTHAHQTIVVLATLFLGAIVAPINPECPLKECLQLVKILKPKMCFCDTRTISQIERILVTLNIASEVVNFGHEVAGTTQFCKLFPFKEEDNFRPVFIEHPHKEVAFVLPTQGTSDDPKLVCLSHHNIYVQCLNFMDIFDNPSKVISFFPLSWIFQLILCCACFDFSLTRIMPGTFNERTACKMIHDFVIDVAVLGTDLAMRLLSNVAIRDYNVSCLKSILVGIVNTSKHDMQHMRLLLPNIKFLQVYTLTESGCVAAISVSNYNAALERPGSVGKTLNNCKLKVLSLEGKEPVGVDQFGELYYTGDGLMLGYFKDNTATIAALEKGYFKTGDMAKFDEDGWLYLQGRIDDIIVLENNYRFCPMEIEDVILSHPLVHDVVIIGNTVDMVACIQKKPDSNLSTEKIMGFIGERIPDHKLLTKVIFFDEFPRTSIGNIKKRDLREELLRVKIEYTKSLASISASDRPQYSDG